MLPNNHSAIKLSGARQYNTCLQFHRQIKIVRKSNLSKSAMKNSIWKPELQKQKDL
jgi:hypothetical protein